MELNSIFSSHMVFACGHPIRIYGTGVGEAKITFAGQTKTIVSSMEEWLEEFPPMEYGGPYDLVFECEDEVTVFNDIYVGEVYLFAGQSNMQFKMKESSEYTSDYETNEKLRMFFTNRIVEDGDFYTPKDGWIKCKKTKIGEWSAIGYIAGKELVKAKDIAVGIITCYQGASVIESWVPKGIFEKKGIHIPISQKHSDHSYDGFSKWNSDGALYSYALSQVVPFSLSGVVWYQGESDTSLEESKVYMRELCILIETWRSDFRNYRLPFVIIQLSDYRHRDDEAWKNVQKAQYEIQHKLSNVKTVISYDVCENDNIHPPSKGELSKRVALTLESIIQDN